MSSFSCQHYNVQDETCERVKADCVPGRPGCVLQHNSKFAVPVEERIADESCRKGRAAAELDGVTRWKHS